MAAYAQDSSFLSRRAAVFVVIVAFHILLIYGLANGLARHIVEVVAPPIQADISEQVEEREEPPPPPPPRMERPPVEIPPTDINIEVPAEAPATAITQVTTQRVAPPPPPRAVNRVPPKLDQRRSAPTDDFYPPASKRAGEVGVATVRACVTTDGRTSGTATVEKSSGFPRLDEAAVRWAARARWTPATEDGKPIEACSQFAVRFRLIDE